MKSRQDNTLQRTSCGGITGQMQQSLGIHATTLSVTCGRCIDTIVSRLSRRGHNRHTDPDKVTLLLGQFVSLVSVLEFGLSMHVC